MTLELINQLPVSYDFNHLNKNQKLIMKEAISEEPKTTDQDLEIKEASKEEPQQPKVLIPVFIGTELVDLINLIELVIKEKFPDHTATILSPALYKDLAYKLDFQNKTQQQREAVLKIKNDEKKKMQALDVVTRIQNTFYELPKQFTISDLKAAYLIRKQKISHKQIDELITFLGIHGYIRQVDVDVPSHKMRYQIILSIEETIDQIELKNSAIKLKIDQLAAELKGNEEEIKSLKPFSNIEISPVGQDNKPVESKPVKTRSAAKKQKIAANVQTPPTAR